MAAPQAPASMPAVVRQSALATADQAQRPMPRPTMHDANIKLE
jgi:hypothetical protein